MDFGLAQLADESNHQAEEHAFAQRLKAYGELHQRAHRCQVQVRPRLCPVLKSN